jgi:phosphoglycerate dehydrogenase-like enzyme
MAADTIFVLVGVPAAVRAAIGEEHFQRLTSAHPRAEVAIVDDPNRFAALLPRADAALTWLGMASWLAPALRPGGRLRWVHALTAGVDDLLTPAVIGAEHVLVTSSKGPMGPLIAEHALLLMLALARDLPGYVRDQEERRWRFLADERPMVDLFGKTALILGVGAVGGNLARMCKLGFQMHVLGTARTRRDNPHVDRYIEPPDLHAALGAADFVALCLAQTAETTGIIDAPALAAMKPSAYLVNVARGGLVDEVALVAALSEGHIAGAGLDATAVEPLPTDSPLWGMPNVIVTPHIAPGRDQLGRELSASWCENIRRFVEGQPLLGVVDRHARY